MKKAPPESEETEKENERDASKRPLSPKEKLHGRTSAARFLGLSRSGFMRRERLGLYAPDFTDARGSRFYTETKLQKLKKMIGRTERAPMKPRKASPLEPKSKTLNVSYSAEEAALAFDAFEAGKDPVAIVREHKLHPHVVRELMIQWTDFRDSIVLPLTALRVFTGELSESPTSEEIVKSLAANFKAEGRKALLCGTCRKRPQLPMCAECAVDAARAARPPAKPLATSEPSRETRTESSPGEESGSEP